MPHEPYTSDERIPSGELAVKRIRAISSAPRVEALDLAEIRARITADRRVAESLRREAGRYEEEADALEAMLAEVPQ